MNHHFPTGLRKSRVGHPSHIAIIMDGNGRWARRRSLPRIAGHHEGMKTVRKITRIANDIGVKVLTLYAFSTENWKRPKMEIDFLMKLPGEFLDNIFAGTNRAKHQSGNDRQFRCYYRPIQKEAIVKAMDATANNDGLILNFAMNYGSRLEMVQGNERNRQLAVDKRK